MKYKSYIGSVHYDAKDKIFRGEVIGINDVIAFQGYNVDELESDFHNTIDTYLELCRERGEKPANAFSGTFNLRISPELHAKLAMASKVSRISMNELITRLLTQIME
jgi:predicted HicB family RNase H-like nuclease